MKRVFVIDDDPQGHDDLLRLLREHGYSIVQGGEDGQFLLERSDFRAGGPDGADSGMPLETSREAGFVDIMIHEQPICSGESLQRTLLDSPTATLVLQADDGTILDGNNPFVQLSGYDRDEMIGQNILNLFFFLDPEQWSQAFRTVEQVGAVHDLRTRMWTKHGLVMFVVISLQRQEKDGIPCHVMTLREQTSDTVSGQPVPANPQMENGDFSCDEVGRLIDFRALQDLMNSFYKITRIGIGITDIKGYVQVATGWQDVCTRFHRVNPETFRNCLESDIYLSREVGRGEAIYKCKNGMWDMATPLIIGGRHIANIFLGQFFFEGEVPDYDFFREQAKTHGFDVAEYLAALDRVPRWNRELVQDVMEFYRKLAVMISRLSIGNIQLSQALATQKRISLELRQVKLVVENSPVVLFRWRAGEGWPVELVSGNVARFGYTREQLLSGSVPFSTLVHPDDLQRVVAEVDDYSEAGEDSFQQEYRMVTREGEVRWIDGRTLIERDATGRVTHYQGTVMDISERKVVEEKLRLTQYCVDNAAVDIFLVVPGETKIIYVNEHLCRSTGYTREELYCLTVLDLDPFTTREKLEELDRQFLANGSIQPFEGHMRRKDGTFFPVEISASNISFEGKELAICFALDISERRRAEEALRKSDERMRLYFERQLVGMAITSPEKGWLQVNDKLCRMLGYEREELIRLSWDEMTHPDDLAADEACFQRLMTGEINDYSLEKRFIRKDGTTVYANLSVGCVRTETGAVDYVLALLEDISDRKRIEQQLRFTQFAIDKTIDQAFWMTADSRLFYVNEAACRALGYSRQELEGMSIPDIDPTFSPEVFAEHWRDIRVSGSVTFETWHRSKNGRVYPVEIRANYVVFDGREYNCAFATDISERRRAEDELRESEQKFRVLAETLPAAIMLHQGEKFIYVNPATSLITGYSEAELLGMYFWEWCRKEDWDAIRERSRARLRGEAKPNQYEYLMMTKRGEEKWVVVSAGLTEYRGKSTIIATLLDITEAKQVEERMQAALAEKTVLLKEVHHRVKNNLQIISSLLDLQSDSIPDELSRSYLRESQNRVRSMALVHERLYLSRNLDSIDFGVYIRDLSQYLVDSYGVKAQGVSLMVNGTDVTLGINEAIPCGLILNELVSNALKHAFPGHGPGEISINYSEENGWISFRVADTGTGLPAGLDYRNTHSLGLQLVNMLVKQLRGRITVDAEEGGTTFFITFPTGVQGGGAQV